MDKDTETAVEAAGASAAAEATAAAPEAAATPAKRSRAAEIFAEAEGATASELEEVREELSRAEQVVVEWCNEHFYNSPISRATEALNYLRQHAVPDLIAKIKEI